MLIIDTDPDRLDVGFIHRFLTGTYWAHGRTPEEVQRSIDHSLNFGLYERDRQIGFARVVSDRVSIAYLMDLFVEERERGKGYARLLLERALTHPELADVTCWRLSSADAQGLYRKYGFEPVAPSSAMMERRVS